VVTFEHRYDLGVLGQARGVDNREPVIKGLAIGGLDVADLGLQGGVNVHQVPSAGVGAAARAQRFRPLTHLPINLT
jgi:hypothetical protein